jgi:hypothetical protein
MISCGNVKTNAILIGLLALASLAVAEETSFHDVKITNADGTQNKASLVFDDDAKAVVVQAAKSQPVTIPYDQIDSVSYEFTKKHRLKQGIAVGFLSPGTGLIIALTKSRSHWLDISFHEQEVAKDLVLRLDKHSYQRVCDAAKTHTGKEVVLLGKTYVHH